MSATARLSQNDRVLRALRRGPVGPASFLPPTVCDQGDPILRLGARIGVLRDRGHVIESRRDKSGCAVYRLIREAASEAQGLHECSTPSTGIANRSVGSTGSGQDAHALLPEPSIFDRGTASGERVSATVPPATAPPLPDVVAPPSQPTCRVTGCTRPIEDWRLVLCDYHVEVRLDLLADAEILDDYDEYWEPRR